MTNQNIETTTKKSWAQAMRVYLEPASVRMLFLGFAAGLPLLLVLGTLSFRLREAGINRATISFLSWVGLAYGFKWIWAPLVDRLPIPVLTSLLGCRRSWLLLSQALIMLGLIGMAFADPTKGLNTIVRMSLLVAFASATQDIALDAFRIESASQDRQAALASTYQTGYRLAMIMAGAGVFRIASSLENSSVQAIGYSNYGWKVAYLVMAAAMLVGVLMVFLSPEPVQQKVIVNTHKSNDPIYLQAKQRLSQNGVSLAGLLAFPSWALFVISAVAQAAKAGWMQSIQQVFNGYALWFIVVLAGTLTALAVKNIGPRWRVAQDSLAHTILARSQSSFVSPFVDFFQRYGYPAIIILLLIGIYRISDVVMGNMSNQFYVDMQFTKDQVGLVSGVFGIFFTLLGTFIGGVLAMRVGVMRVLMLGAILSAASNLMFAWMSNFPEMAHLMWNFSFGSYKFSMPSTLTIVIAGDNISGGIASAAFIAYLSGLTNINYSATQYALFSSIMLLIPKFISGFSGTYVNSYGYSTFFISTAILGIPVLILVWLASRILPVQDEDSIS